MQYGLTEEQIMLRDTVRRLAQDQILRPGAAARDEKEEFPWDAVEVFRENGLFACDFKEEYGGAQMGMLAFCLAVEEVAKVCASSSSLILLVPRAGLHAHDAGGQRRAERPSGSPAWLQRRAFGCLWPHRAGGGQRCGGPAHPCGEKGRQVHHQRHQAVHQPRRRGPVRLHRLQHRSGQGPPQGRPEHHRGGKGHSRVFHRQKRAQDGHPGLHHLRGDSGGLRGAGRQPFGPARATASTS